jgi:hypothetical protein
MSYTVYKVNVLGKRSHKEHLNNLDEVNEWIASKWGKYAMIMVISDTTKKVINFRDTGMDWWEKVPCLGVTD